MKKTLIAMAALAATGIASAQSSVTLFGIVDATYQHASTSGSNSITRLTNSGYNGSRLGFRGTEDLGGGMSASFWLEAGVNNDDGTGAGTNTNNQAGGAAAAAAGGQGLTFNRRSTVSLAGGFGELRLGRDYTPHFWNQTVFDPFGTNGIGTSRVLASGTGGLTAVRASNSIGYFLPGNLGGFYGQVQYYMGENASNAAGGTQDDGRGFSGRVGYANGPVNVAAGYGRTVYVAGDIATTNIGASYNFGVATAMFLYNTDKNNVTTAKQTGYLVGASVPVGAGEVRLSYSTSKASLTTAKSTQIALGYVHNLSKRTAVYATYARVGNSNGALAALGGTAGVANASSSGYDLGVRHSF